MRILTVSDEESSYYYDHYVPGRLEGFDLILSCGDLRREYLEFLSTLAGCPVVYVRGNHDDRLENAPPEGCLCAEDKIVVCHGLRILGLGGSMRYSRGPHQYTEREMALRALRLAPKLLWKKGFDILLTHAPGRGMVECRDLAHTGFETFNRLLDRYQPALFLHGHTHMNYGRSIPRESRYGVTRVVNGYERFF